ncbi:helix-turn-helix transcriptional regulator [Actinacidiphila sp. DG2A-62]|uniref:helix-turn-helix domain-containing protein n=1 Tax=Actinacidiphila sp. DG2A-62 TaxID=3108821 RepID=UPI002DB5993B|nr:helix-turn-helix transcriptional regulator [Actinacidiphila sp. DG2A-62]MEC3994965.1 helix-turn-helix transcriptional regulator [Actinacidiphila sp. DG2A-62]
MTSLPTQRPEGALIQSAQRTLGISAAEAARRAGISPSRWRQIVLGYQTVSGIATPVTGPDATVARMARAVGLTPTQLQRAGCTGAADALRSIAARPPVRHRSPADAPPSALAERWRLVEFVLQHALAGLAPADAAALRTRAGSLLRRRPSPG